MGPAPLPGGPAEEGAGAEAVRDAVRAWRELRRTVETAYIERRASHEATPDALNLSRSAYFARLRRGVERVVPYALDGLARAAG